MQNKQSNESFLVEASWQQTSENHYPSLLWHWWWLGVQRFPQSEWQQRKDGNFILDRGWWLYWWIYLLTLG